MPDVSVVIAVHDGMPEVTAAVRSALGQSLDPARVEVIVVDDGSTDGTADELRRLQAEHPRLSVFHQEASGGPSRPRNVGLGRARGRFVFFLDADDRLGDEALERMLAMADAHDSDVVLGKIVSERDGSSARIYAKDDPDVDLFDSTLVWTTSAQKLFRRSVLEGPPPVRFPEDLWTGEDAVFTMRAYLRASRISVLASYDCYYKGVRPGGGHLTQRGGIEPRFRAIRSLMEVVGDAVDEGPRRDALLRRSFAGSILAFYGRRFLGFSDAQRDQVVELTRPLVERWLSPRLHGRFAPVDRLRLELARRSRVDLLVELERWVEADGEPDVVLDDGVRYEALPFFRDARAGVPDEVFRVTSGLHRRHPVLAVRRQGRSGVLLTGATSAPAGAAARLVLRDRRSGVEHRVDATVYGPDGAVPGLRPDERTWTAAPDLARVAGGRLLPASTWDLYLEVGTGTQVDRERIGWRREDVPRPGPWRFVGRSARGGPTGAEATVYFTQGQDAVSIRIRAVDVGAVVAMKVLPAGRKAPTSTRGALRRLSKGLLRRAGVVRGQPGTAVVGRTRDLAVTRGPGRAFVVAPRGDGVRVRRLGGTAFAAFSGASAREVAPGRLVVTADGADGGRTVPLMAGATLLTSAELEDRRWLEHERAILGYAAERHIVGVLRSYGVTCVLDVGANRGQYGSLLRRAGYDGHIVSFEPVPAMVEALEEISANDDKWHVHAMALGAEDGTLTMHVVPGQGTLSSMLPPSEYGKGRFPTMQGVEEREVPVRRLEDVLDAVTAHVPQPRLYLKLDTQGFDLAVFEGLGDRVEDVVALQSELALLQIYDGMPRMPQALERYEAAGFEVSGLFPVSREFTTTRVLEYDCVLVRASAIGR